MMAVATTGSPNTVHQLVQMLGISNGQIGLGERVTIWVPLRIKP